MVDGVFEEVAGHCDVQAAAPGVVFHPGGGIDGDAVLEVQATLRRRILRAFVGRGLLESFEAKEMLAYKHSGFSVDAGVRIEAHDRAGLERLLRYCARPPFAMDRLRKVGAELVYRCGKQHSEPTREKRGTKADALHLSPLELIARIAALVPPTYARTCTAQAYSALPVGGADGPYLRSIAAAVPDLRWADAHHRVHYT